MFLLARLSRPTPPPLRHARLHVIARGRVGATGPGATRVGAKMARTAPKTRNRVFTFKNKLKLVFPPESSSFVEEAFPSDGELGVLPDKVVRTPSTAQASSGEAAAAIGAAPPGSMGGVIETGSSATRGVHVTESGEVHLLAVLDGEANSVAFASPRKAMTEASLDGQSPKLLIPTPGAGGKVDEAWILEMYPKVSRLEPMSGIRLVLTEPTWVSWNRAGTIPRP